MLTLSVLLYCLAGFGLLFMGYKYITTIPPIDYHAAILAKGSHVTDEFVIILGVLYKVMGGCFAAMGAATLILTLTGVRADMFTAKLVILVMVGIAGYFATTTARAVEQQTGVTTPWRIAAGLTGLTIFAFVFSLL